MWDSSQFAENATGQGIVNARARDAQSAAQSETSPGVAGRETIKENVQAATVLAISHSTMTRIN